MPLVAHSDLPSFERLRSAGQEVLALDRARHQDIRELHVGLLNMMPDAALEATERQFMRLVGSCNRIAQIHVHPFAVDAGARGPKARGYIDRYYESFDDVRAAGLDALIISGANPAQPEMEDEPFWTSLVGVMEWAAEHVCSVVCSCLATHAYLRHFHGVARRRCLPGKRWGVYEHRNLAAHPLVANLNTRFDAPHSHVYEMTRADVEPAGVQVLSESEEAGIYLAVSADGFRFVFFQGHPEYDTVSLAKEYKREVVRFIAGEREVYPVYPERYFAARPARCSIGIEAPCWRRKRAPCRPRRFRTQNSNPGSTTPGRIPGRRCSTTGWGSYTSSPTPTGENRSCPTSIRTDPLGLKTA